jgi:hypothetical protein
VPLLPKDEKNFRGPIFLGSFCRRLQLGAATVTTQAEQGAEKPPNLVILSEAKNLSSI